MKPTLKSNGGITSICPDCSAISNFEAYGSIIQAPGSHTYAGKTWGGIMYSLHRCTGCSRGGVSKIHTNTNNWSDSELESFFPFSREIAPLPSGTPDGIVSEFREAELCASFGAYRAASAMFRSALEKVLKENGFKAIAKSGFDTMSLQKKIDEAATDGVITESARIRAHDEVRVLGNDVMHDDWCVVPEDDVVAAHHYTQRIIEAFYDHRPTVEKTLKAKGRM